MDTATEKAIAEDLATLKNPIDLITDQPWTASEMYEYTESVIAQRQGTGQEAISNRIADASANSFREMTEGEAKYLSGKYLHRAASAGLLRKQMNETNKQLVEIIKYQDAISIFNKAESQIKGEFKLPDTVKDELDADIPNPEYTAAIDNHSTALELLNSLSFDDWKLLAQRFSGVAIEDEIELLLAIVNVIPEINILESVIENNTEHKVNKRKTLVNAKSELVGLIQPVVEQEEFIDV